MARAKIKYIPRETLGKDAIHRLDSLKRDIRSGAVTGVAMVAVTREGNTQYFLEQKCGFPRMIGGLEWLKHSVMKEWEKV